jgi:GAF domain-containing protein
MLEQMTQRLQAQRSFEGAIDTILNDVVALHGAEYGDLQLACGNDLVIVAQRGLPAAFLRAFSRVTNADGCACARAFRLRRTVVISDVTHDLDFAPFRRDAELAGYRAVQSTPIMTRDGAVLGVVSTMFANPHEPTPIEIETLGRYCTLAAGHLVALAGRGRIAGRAEQLSRALCADAMA